jgi:hypothetical protein
MPRPSSGSSGIGVGGVGVRGGAGMGRLEAIAAVRWPQRGRRRSAEHRGSCQEKINRGLMFLRARDGRRRGSGKVH